jgi:hypothetical protein
LGEDVDRVPCDSGKYAKFLGASSCIGCAPGRFAATIGSIVCAFCGDDEFQTASTASSCIKVQPGYYRSGGNAQGMS